ncbi:cysteine--tRNA ligase [Candidatus Saccharibacteria bacterium]|nr:cysteine--tRNA ligase [Candidatus Saccharibacteria bacterium]
MKLYNTLTRKIEPFVPENKDEVKIYTCGPTVYSHPHIGNYASYIYWDLLIRTLRANDYKINRILNITDVGHLSSDADEGEDKLEKGAARENKTVWEIAEYYIKDFLAGYNSLNLVKPDKITRATDYIEQDIKLVDLLTKKGYTYELEDGVYFNTDHFSRYADFAKLDLKHLQAGARVEFNAKKLHPSDFAVWKFIRPDETHAMRWDYLGRPGYPGWHLECSTIIHTELGEPIDIHTGGIDHIPVHHTNEIAQSEAAFDTKLSRFWLHCNFITIDGNKISKSLGNVYTLEDLKKRGFSPLDFKMWILQGHYQSERNFTFDDLAAAKRRRLNWRNRIALLYQDSELPNDFSSGALKGAVAASQGAVRPSFTPSEKVFENSLLEHLDDNLNSAAAFSLIDNSELTLADWQKVDELFGLNLIDDTPDIPDSLKDLIRQREQARADKDFTTADKIRQELEENNIIINDSPTGPIWEYKA